MDIHPFVGNKETKAMAIDNILYMIKNYYFCSECDSVVVGWVMSENTINKIISGILGMQFQVFSFVLICTIEALTDRWGKDTITEWRNDDELSRSIESLESYNLQKVPYLIDTSTISADKVAEIIISKIM